MNTRPTELVSGFIGSILALLVAFGINLTDDQIAAVLGVVGWVPLIITFVVSARRGESLFPTAKDEEGYGLVEILGAVLLVLLIVFIVERL